MKKEQKKIYIIGAGPSGLITGLELVNRGYSVTVFEKANSIGGMCRTWSESDYLLDTGPHIYHTPDKELSDYWKNEFSDVLIEGDFWSKNVENGDINKLVDYPISWESINSFEEDLRKDILSEIIGLDQNKSIGAKNFKEYVYNLVGKTLAEKFFTKYPEKVWGIPTIELTADWAPKRIEIREKTTPFYHGQFAAVGKYGTGSVYNKIAENFIKKGGIIKLNNGMSSISSNNDNITAIRLSNGEEIKVENDILISTIPINLLGNQLGIDSNLKFRGIASVYVACLKEKIIWPDNIHWLYFDYVNYSFNRITNSNSLSPYVCPENQTLLTIETTYSKGDSIDLLTKPELEKKILSELIMSGMIKNIEDVLFISSNKEPYVYPLQYPGFQIDLAEIKSKVGAFSNLYSIGTGGDFNYADSQVIFYKAYDLVNIITGEESAINQTKKTKKRTEFNKIVNLLEFKIGDHSDSEPIIIGEIGLNHNGNFDIAIQLIDEAVKCGLKFVKLQTYNSGNSRVSDKVKSANYVEKITDQEETISQMFDKYNMTLEDQTKIFEYARSKGLTIFSTPFDKESALFLNNVLNVDCFKIASVDLVNLPLIKEVAGFNKPMLVSCGMARLSEVEDALDAISQTGNSNVILLHCNSTYPAPIEDMNLSVINTLKSSFKVPVGLSDHTFGLLASKVAISIGANVIERHFTLDKYMEGPDHILSSEPSEMKELVELAKKIPKILGNGIKRVQDGEYFNINLQRKCLYANRDILEGEIIQNDDLVVKGPGGGILPKFLDIVIGKKATKKINKDHPILWNTI